jgi:hypothetical protein
MATKNAPEKGMKRVEFTQDYVYETEGPGKGPSFKQGEVYDLRGDIADSFQRLGVVDITDDPGMIVPIQKIADAPPKPAEEKDTAEPAKADVAGGREATAKADTVVPAAPAAPAVDTTKTADANSRPYRAGR